MSQPSNDNFNLFSDMSDEEIQRFLLDSIEAEKAIDSDKLLSVESDVASTSVVDIDDDIFKLDEDLFIQSKDDSKDNASARSKDPLTDNNQISNSNKNDDDELTDAFDALSLDYVFDDDLQPSDANLGLDKGLITQEKKSDPHSNLAPLPATPIKDLNSSNKSDIEDFDLEGLDIEKPVTKKASIEKSNTETLDSGEFDIADLDVDFDNVEFDAEALDVDFDLNELDIDELDFNEPDEDIDVKKLDTKKLSIENLDIEDFESEDLESEKLDTKKFNAERQNIEDLAFKNDANEHRKSEQDISDANQTQPDTHKEPTNDVVDINSLSSADNLSDIDNLSSIDNSKLESEDKPKSDFEIKTAEIEKNMRLYRQKMLDIAQQSDEFHELSSKLIEDVRKLQLLEEKDDFSITYEQVYQLRGTMLVARRAFNEIPNFYDVMEQAWENDLYTAQMRQKQKK